MAEGRSRGFTWNTAPEDVMMICVETCSDRTTASHLRRVWLLGDGAPVTTVTRCDLTFAATHLEELSDQLTELTGVVVGYWLVAPPADFTDQLLQTAGLKLQVNTGEFLYFSSLFTGVDQHLTGRFSLRDTRRSHNTGPIINSQPYYSSESLILIMTVCEATGLCFVVW